MQRGCIKLVIVYFRTGETVRRDAWTALLMAQRKFVVGKF